MIKESLKSRFINNVLFCFLNGRRKEDLKEKTGFAALITMGRFTPSLTTLTAKPRSPLWRKIFADLKGWVGSIQQGLTAHQYTKAQTTAHQSNMLQQTQMFVRCSSVPKAELGTYKFDVVPSPQLKS